MNHIHDFIDEVQSVKKKRFIKNGKKGSGGGWVRPTAVYIVWKFNGLRVADVAKIFGLNDVSVYYCIGRCTGYHEVGDSLFIKQYNELLELYIKTTTIFFRKQNLSHLKQVA